MQNYFDSNVSDKTGLLFSLFFRASNGPAFTDTFVESVI